MELMEAIFEWMREHQAIPWSLAAASAAVFFVSLLAMPAVVNRIRADYFTFNRRPRARWSDQHLIVRALLLCAKNVLGWAFMLAGIAMLVLPGQGLLTMFMGFLLIDCPGKYRLEKWLVRRRYILQPINWLRRRAGREPLRTD